MGDVKWNSVFLSLEIHSWIYLKNVVTFKSWIKKLAISDKILKQSGIYY